MTDPDQSAAQAEFTPELGKVARRELGVHGYTTYAQLAEVSSAQLLHIHGIGPKAIRLLSEELRARGLRFQDD
jgi:hypothetical protein